MTMNYEHFFMFPKIMQKCSKLCSFSLIIDLKTSGKRPFLQPHLSYLETWFKLETIYKPPQGSHLFGKGSFVAFDPANLEAIGNKHMVSDSVIAYLKLPTFWCDWRHGEVETLLEWENPWFRVRPRFDFGPRERRNPLDKEHEQGSDHHGPKYSQPHLRAGGTHS